MAATSVTAWSVRARGALLTLGAAALAIWLTGAAMRQQHLAGYRGVCGPHAPDIAAHPCSREVHAREFAAGFEGVALFAAQGTAALLAVLTVHVSRRAPRRRSPPDDGGASASTDATGPRAA